MNVRLNYLAPPLLATLLGAYLGLRGPTSVGNQMLFMDVGQGDCTVILSRDSAMLVDVGPKTPSFDAGERIVVPDLLRHGIHPSAVLLTHPDTDHVGGLAAVSRAFPGIEVFASREFRTSKHMIDELRAARIPEEHLHWLPGHANLQVGDWDLDAYAQPWHVGENDNEGSIVMRVSHANASAVLMGDAGVKTESKLLMLRSWGAQILKVGHHGSRFSSSPAWLSAVKPMWAVISCGAHNSYGHPHRDTMDRLRAVNAIPVRTDESGDIWFSEEDSGFRLVR